MKNKKLTIGLTLLMAGSVILTNCTKNKTSEAPSPDNETQSTKDMSRIATIVGDIIEIGAQGGDGASGLLPYLSYSPLVVMQGTTTINSTGAVLFVDQGSKYYTLTFSNTVGKDGHVRNGVLKYDYFPSTLIDSEFSSAPPLVDYYRQPAFRADVTSIGYSVDDYTIGINSFRITNTTPIGFPNITPYTPALGVKLTWRNNFDVSLSRAVGTTTETSTFVGTIYKTLLNTANTPVPMPLISPQTFTIYQGPAYGSLNWAKAYYSYNGTAVANLPNIGPTNVTMTDLTRNMNNSPEAFYMDGTSMLLSPEKHPFVSGYMSFKPGSKPSREVNFGVGEVVDYNAKVTIEGITYDVDCN